MNKLKLKMLKAVGNSYRTPAHIVYTGSGYDLLDRNGDLMGIVTGIMQENVVAIIACCVYGQSVWDKWEDNEK